MFLLLLCLCGVFGGGTDDPVKCHRQQFLCDLLVVCIGLDKCAVSPFFMFRFLYFRLVIRWKFCCLMTNNDIEKLKCMISVIAIARSKRSS